jgi:hypothetical protein
MKMEWKVDQHAVLTAGIILTVNVETKANKRGTACLKTSRSSDPMDGASIRGCPRNTYNKYLLEGL